ncbi:hypothetical protein JYU34_009699 [Plutella xylostella]|uniref:C2H2-type domain-containing protein n=1 Tax=Plutella xylostella TaxID=51655 RepID=A0ABQ7QK94_PLUXY|nr:hypothetical protein JYU34_009699 [Plutella xylostella]
MNSNGKSDKITLNSCQYTPIYLIQNSSVSEGRSFVLAPTIKEDSRPVSNNLKLFYENSGNIENSVLIDNVQYVANPPAAPAKKVQEPLGNNLKLASFLVPKKDATKDQYIATISNKILKPTVNSSNTNVLPNINIVTSKPNGSRSKANAPRTLINPRLLPKIKPKEKIPEPSKQSSVHLLKLGGSYHSLNQLNEQQIKIVNHALDNIKLQGNAEKATKQLKPTYDPVTNTRIIYKIVSPNDLKVIGKNKIVLKTAAPIKEETATEVFEQDIQNHGSDTKNALEAKPEPVPEVKVTRSGRTVKLPKQLQQTQDDPPPKAKKKVLHQTVVSCFQCSSEFQSIYRLQRHYEDHPTHIPANLHTSLFHCLLAMVQDGTEEEKASVFIKQLEQLVEKLRALLPCLLMTVNGGETTECTINEDVGRLFGMNPGKYNMNIDALSCVKDKGGSCRHNNAPTQIQINPDISQPTQIWVTQQQEDTPVIESEGEDCARINPVDKWQVKRIWKHKLNHSDSKNVHKKIKLICEPVEPLIELGSETLDSFVDNSKHQVTFVVDKNDVADETDKSTKLKEPKSLKIIDSKKSKGTHSQFYSTHFDIRSSPIKPSSTVFNKFQIIPDKMPLKFDPPILQPLSFEPQNEQNQDSDMQIQHNSENSLDLNIILKELTSTENHSTNIVSEDLITSDNCKESDILAPLTFASSKDWPLGVTSDDQSQDNCIKPNSLIVPAMLHVQDSALINSTDFSTTEINYNNRGTNYNETAITTNDNAVSNDTIMLDNNQESNQGSSVLNFLESLGNDCLSCPETELRNNSIDFSLDLFSFNHT